MTIKAWGNCTPNLVRLEPPLFRCTFSKVFKIGIIIITYITYPYIFHFQRGSRSKGPLDTPLVYNTMFIYSRGVFRGPFA